MRYVEVTPRNPKVMGSDEQERVGEGFAAMAGRLRPGQSLQFYVEAAPVLLRDVLDTTREEVDRALAEQPPERVGRAAAPGRRARAVAGRARDRSGGRAVSRLRRGPLPAADRRQEGRLGRAAPA